MKDKNKTNPLLWIVGLVVVIAIVFAIPLFANNNLFGPSGVVEDQTNGQVGEGGGEVVEDNTVAGEQGANVESIVENPSQYYGQQVTLSAEVERRVSNRVLALEVPGLLENDLLVVSTKEFTPQADNSLLDDTFVRVVGTVREFNIREIENEVGFDLNDEQLAEFEGFPVVVADSVTTINPNR